MSRLVLGPEILAAALCSASGASNALLNEVAYQRLSVLVTAPLMAEYRLMLLSPAQRLMHGRAEEAVERFITALAAAAERVATDFQWRPQLSDTLDELTLQAGVMGRADALVTLRPTRFAAARQLELKVVTPAELLGRLR